MTSTYLQTPAPRCWRDPLRERLRSSTVARSGSRSTHTSSFTYHAQAIGSSVLLLVWEHILHDQDFCVAFSAVSGTREHLYP